MYSFQSFLNLVNGYQKTHKELSKCNKFSKQFPNSTKWDLIAFCSKGVEQDFINIELNGLIEESKLKKWEILISSYHFEKNRIYLKLVRSSLVKAVFAEIFEKQSAFGNSNVFHDKIYEICCAECSGGLTHLRLVTAAGVVAALIARGDGTVIRSPADGAETIILSATNQSNGHFILVNQVEMADATGISEKDFRQLRREDMLALGDHKGINESSLDKIVNTAVTFDLLSIKLEKPIVLDSLSQPSSARKSNCKGATFVLYNYARLCAILDRYNHFVTNGIYKPLQQVNYDLLSDDDEWRLVFGFLVEWPAVVLECQDLRQPKIHKITGFLSALASTFSVFYRHSRVLNDGMAHMLPLMEARIHLLMAIKHVFLAAFSVLGIDAPTTM